MRKDLIALSAAALLCASVGLPAGPARADHHEAATTSQAETGDRSGPMHGARGTPSATAKPGLADTVRITAVDTSAGTILVLDDDASQPETSPPTSSTVRVDEDTIIDSNGKRLRIQDLKPGDRVVIEAGPATTGSDGGVTGSDTRLGGSQQGRLVRAKRIVVVTSPGDVPNAPPERMAPGAEPGLGGGTSPRPGGTPGAPSLGDERP